MANKNFTDFTLKTPASGDFLVGYNADGSTEIRTTVGAFALSAHTHLASQISNSTTVGRSLMTATDAAAARAAIGAGTVSEGGEPEFQSITLSDSPDSLTLSANAAATRNNLGLNTASQMPSGSFATTTALNAASSILLPTSVYRATSGTFLVSDTTTAPTASSISNVILISQTDYNNLPIKFANTLYFIV